MNSGELQQIDDIDDDDAAGSDDLDIPHADARCLGCHCSNYLTRSVHLI